MNVQTIVYNYGDLVFVYRLRNHGTDVIQSEKEAAIAAVAVATGNISCGDKLLWFFFGLKICHFFLHFWVHLNGTVTPASNYVL